MASEQLHVFWSGDRAKEEAQNWAQNNNCVVLESTHIADFKDKELSRRRLESLKKGKSMREIWFHDELPEWEKLSYDFALSSPYRTVHVFINVSYKEPEEMQNSDYKEKPWLKDFYYGWSNEDIAKFRNMFPDNKIPKSMKECCYDRKKSILHRVEHPLLKEMGKELKIHYVK